MIVRLTYLVFAWKSRWSKKDLCQQVVHVVKQQKGNLDCRLLEPINKNEDFISLTAWETEADANAYHTSGVYKQLVDKVRATYSKDPILKVYSSESVMEPV